MKIYILFLAVFLSSMPAQAREVQLFNPELFGQPTSTAVKLLIGKKPGEIEPYMVPTDQETEGIFRVTYIQFFPSKVILKAMMKREGGDAKAIDAMNEKDCKEAAGISK